MKLTHIPARHPSSALPLVLIHGWGHNSRVWQPLLDTLDKPRDYWLVDLPGFYGEPAAHTPSWQALLDQLQQQLPKAYLLLGWSLGGNLAAQLAARSPAVNGLLTLACNPCFVASEAWPQAMAPLVFEQFCEQFAEAPEATRQRFLALQLQGEPARKSLAQQLKPLLPAEVAPAHWLTALHWLAELDHRALLAALTIPQQHLFGAQDALVPAAVVAHLPNARVLAGAGHLLPLSQIPAIGEALIQLDAQVAQLDTHARRPSKTRVADSFSRAASRYDSAASLQVEVGDTLLQYLPPTAPSPRLLDLGCGTGFLSRRLPQHPLIALDIAPAMLQQARQQLGQTAQWLQADAEQLPFTANSLDGVLANLSLQWCQLPLVLGEVARVLVPGGWCLFSTLGPRSLGELKSAWQTIDPFVHVNRFTSDAEVRTAAAASGLAVEVFQQQDHLVYQRELLPLLKNLKAIGARNLNPGQKAGLMTPKHWQQLQAAYEMHRNVLGELVATYEVFYVVVRKAGA